MFTFYFATAHRVTLNSYSRREEAKKKVSSIYDCQFRSSAKKKGSAKAERIATQSCLQMSSKAHQFTVDLRNVLHFKRLLKCNYKRKRLIFDRPTAGIVMIMRNSFRRVSYYDRIVDEWIVLSWSVKNCWRFSIKVLSLLNYFFCKIKVKAVTTFFS